MILWQLMRENMGKPKIILDHYSNSVSVKVNAIRSFFLS